MCTKITPRGFHKYKNFSPKQNNVYQTMKNNFVDELCYV